MLANMLFMIFGLKNKSDIVKKKKLPDQRNDSKHTSN